ncbi:Nuclear receptor 2C2-associated protein [Bulinus truncatus]|nr:Nuclear receptor 2C2-associated protein [Bulinus truncatus]
MAESSGSLNNKISRTRVSSVLNKDVKQFGKQHLFDGDEETCWNSDQGALQWVMVDFNEEVQISEIHIQFQGGFVGKVCSLEKSDSGSSNLIKILNFCPSDSSQKQVIIVFTHKPKLRYCFDYFYTHIDLKCL